jgi:hypothetical protein
MRLDPRGSVERRGNKGGQRVDSVWWIGAKGIIILLIGDRV